MIASWLAGKLSGIIIFCMACLMPICAIGWAVEGVELHGIHIPFPIWGPINLVDGAIGARDAAVTARNKALSDLGTARGNESRLSAGLDQCNASVEKLGAAGKLMVSTAQDMIDKAAALQKSNAAGLAAMAAIKSTDEKCPVALSILQAGLQ